MIIYNTTFVLAPNLEEKFLHFVRCIYVPKILSDGVLSSPSLRRIDSCGADEAQSYALSFCVSSRAILMAYLEQSEQLYLRDIGELFGEEVLCFSTLMQELEI